MTPPEGSTSRHSHPFQLFFETETAGSVLLLVSAAAALIATNSPWAEQYERFWSIPIAIHASNHGLSLSLHHLISDGLMTVFFLLMGLEIKRELIAGELSGAGHTALPVSAAIGGMVLPASIYLLFNHDGIAMRGWGIPMATDIAFALGTLVVIAPGIPIGAKVFLTALAIADDMGAVGVIALFYTQALDWSAIAFAALMWGFLLTLNVARIQRLMPYLLLGVPLWYFIHRSGVHPTITGVLLAAAIPTGARINAADFSAKARALLEAFDRTETGDQVVLTSKGQQEALFALGRAGEAVTAPLLRLEQALHGISGFVIMPLFALSNAGVRFTGSPLSWSVLLGVAVGLAVGKPLGIGAAALGLVSLKRARLPQRVTWKMLIGCGWIGGIGFTMSLFIANLAFENTPLLDSAKLGILAGSLLAGMIAAVVLRAPERRPSDC